MKIINLTQHAATSEQVQAGVFEPVDKAEVQSLLTFVDLPERHELRQRAYALARIAVNAGYEHAMIGGAPYFMQPLENALKHVGVQPLYSFTKREATEIAGEDGTVKKTAVFKHVGFYEA